MASVLFSDNESVQCRPNTIGELMRVIISPTENVEEAVKWALNGGPDPVIALHMRMLMSRFSADLISFSCSVNPKTNTLVNMYFKLLLLCSLGEGHNIQIFSCKVLDWSSRM